MVYWNKTSNSLLPVKKVLETLKRKSVFCFFIHWNCFWSSRALALLVGGNTEMQNTFPFLDYFLNHQQRETKSNKLKLFKGEWNALLSNLDFCENKNEYAVYDWKRNWWFLSYPSLTFCIGRIFALVSLHSTVTISVGLSELGCYHLFSRFFTSVLFSLFILFAALQNCVGTLLTFLTLQLL